MTVMDAHDLHNDAMVIDGLIVSNWSRSVFEDMQRGGLTAANCTCAVWEGFRATVENIAGGSSGSTLGRLNRRPTFDRFLGLVARCRCLCG
jgi:microsomal dipeptidase-like Zn-dependent dipeptidase